MYSAPGLFVGTFDRQPPRFGVERPAIQNLASVTAHFRTGFHDKHRAIPKRTNPPGPAVYGNLNRLSADAKVADDGDGAVGIFLAGFNAQLRIVMQDGIDTQTGRGKKAEVAFASD